MSDKVDEALDLLIGHVMKALALKVKNYKETKAYEREMDPFARAALDLKLQINARDWMIARLLTTLSIQGGQSLCFEDEYVGGKTWPVTTMSPLAAFVALDVSVPVGLPSVSNDTPPNGTCASPSCAYAVRLQVPPQ